MPDRTPIGNLRFQALGFSANQGASELNVWRENCRKKQLPGFLGSSKRRLRDARRTLKFYNLDAIIAVGYWDSPTKSRHTERVVEHVKAM